MSTARLIKDLVAEVTDPSSDLPGWEPATPVDPGGGGGPDSVSPLLNEDGTSAIDPEWAEPRSFGVGPAGAVLASEGPGRQTRIVHERGGTRRVRIGSSRWSGYELELIRRAIQVCGGTAGVTRYRHPMLDAPGDVESAPLIRFTAQVIRIRRSPSGQTAEMSVEYEYVE